MKVSKTLAQMFGYIAITSLVLGVLCVIAYYVTEIISSLFIPLNMVEIGRYFWTAIFICAGVFFCFLILSLWSGIIKVESTNSPKYDRTKAKERREKGPTTKK